MALREGSARVLANQMWLRRQREEAPFVWILGAGASLSSGAPSTYEIVTEIVKNLSNRDTRTLTEKDMFQEFYRVLDNLNDDERLRWLQWLCEKVQISDGYRCLAWLVQGGYVQVILTTNFDDLLERALDDTAMMRDADFRLLTVGREKEAQILKEMKDFQVPRIKVLKLHGSLAAGQIKFTPRETHEFEPLIANLVTEYLSQDIVVVGHSGRDRDLTHCLNSKGDAIWYVNPELPEAGGDIDTAMIMRKGSHIIPGRDGYFDTFCCELKNLLIKKERSDNEQAMQPNLEQTLEDIKEVLQRVDRNVATLLKQQEEEQQR